MLNKEERFQIFLQRLEGAPNAGSAEEAFFLLSSVLNGVEDEFSGVTAEPARWKQDGRMYPPHQDHAHPVEDRPWITQYRSFRHFTYIASNGAIEIVNVRTQYVELSKPGADGKRVQETNG